MFASEELERILEFPSDYIECKEYESWERYFTELLISLTDGTPYKYSKHFLNKYYIQEKNAQKIVTGLPKEIKGKVELPENDPTVVNKIAESRESP